MALRFFWIGIAAIILIGFWTMPDSPLAHEHKPEARYNWAAAEASGPRMPGCTHEVGALSVEHMAPDGSPILFHWFDCTGQMVRRYVDFTGRELARRQLASSRALPDRRLTLEELVGVDIVIVSPELEQLEGDRD